MDRGEAGRAASDAALERARLAAADLLSAAVRAVALRTLKPEDVRDEVDAAVLSRRFTSYAPSGELDDAWADLDFARAAQREIETIAGHTAGTADAGRLEALAAECGRRATALRS